MENVDTTTNDLSMVQQSPDENVINVALTIQQKSMKPFIMLVEKQIIDPNEFIIDK